MATAIRKRGLSSVAVVACAVDARHRASLSTHSGTGNADDYCEHDYGVGDTYADPSREAVATIRYPSATRVEVVFD
jgi:hypothetical protein